MASSTQTARQRLPREARRLAVAGPGMPGGEALFAWSRGLVEALRNGDTAAARLAIGVAPALHWAFFDTVQEGRFPLGVLLEAGAAGQPWSKACGDAFADIVRSMQDATEDSGGWVGFGRWAVRDTGRGDCIGLAMAGESGAAVTAALEAALGQGCLLEVQARLSLDAPGLASVRSLEKVGRLRPSHRKAIADLEARLGSTLVLPRAAILEKVAEAFNAKGETVRGGALEGLTQRYPELLDATVHTRALHRDPVRLLAAATFRDLDSHGNAWQRCTFGRPTLALLETRLAAGRPLLGVDERIALLLLGSEVNLPNASERVVRALLRRDARAGGRLLPSEVSAFMQGAGQRGSQARRAALENGLVAPLARLIPGGGLTADDYLEMYKAAPLLACGLARRCFCRADEKRGEDAIVDDLREMPFETRLTWLRAVLVETHGGVAYRTLGGPDAPAPWWGDATTIETLMRRLPANERDTLVQALGTFHPSLLVMATGVAGRDLAQAGGQRRRRRA